MRSLKVEVVDRGDGLDIRFTSSYRGSRRPTKKEARKAAKAMLQTALSGLDKAEYGGSAEDDRGWLKRDSFLVENNHG